MAAASDTCASCGLAGDPFQLVYLHDVDGERALHAGCLVAENQWAAGRSA